MRENSFDKDGICCIIFPLDTPHIYELSNEKNGKIKSEKNAYGYGNVVEMKITQCSEMFIFPI